MTARACLRSPRSEDEQLDLPLGTRSRLEVAFEEFDRDNPHIYEAFCRFTLEAIRAGRQKIGAKLIWERIRWYTSIEDSARGAEFRLNNNWTAYYARKFMRRNPGYEGLFETRSTSDE